MIVVYDTTTAILYGAFPGSDAGFLALITANLSAGQGVFTLADDAPTLANPVNYKVDNAGAPTTTVAKNIIRLTPSATPINLSDAPTITVQLYQPDDTTPLALAGVTVALTAAPGLLSFSSIVTDAGGTGTVTLKPTKGFGDIGLAGTSDGYRSGGTIVTVSVPTTSDQGNWLETNDIKAEAVREEKLAASVINPNKFAGTSPSIMWTVKKAILEDVKDATLTDSVNSIVSDGIDHIYINGFDTGTPKIKKVNRKTFAVDGSLTYTNNNLANRTDGMVFDGKYLWVASAGDLLQVDPVSMTLIATITIDVSGGNIQALAWDGHNIFAFVRGGVTYLDMILEISRNGTVISATTVSAADVKQIALRKDTQGLQVSGIEHTVLIPIASPFNSLSLMAVNSPGGFATTNFAALSITATANGTAASEGVNFWVGVTPSGGSKQSLLRLSIDTFTNPLTLLGSLEQGQIGIVYDLFYDGTYMWAITSEAGDPPVSSTRRFIRKIRQNDPDPMQLVQTFDMGPNVDPNALCIENDRLFVGNFAATT